MNPVIKTSDLGKRYGGHDAVKDLNLVIPEGASVGLLGPNGAGKSTAIKMMLGLISPTSGEVAVLGKNPAADGAAVRSRVGYVPERQYIYGWMTVAEAIGFTRAFYPTWNDKLCTALVESFALPLGQKVANLSQGMGTKISLILALAHEPQILLLDEPTTGLDPLAREEFVSTVNDLLRDSGKTVLFSSHILSDIEQVADTIAIMCDGTLLTTRPRAELKASTKRIHVTLAHSRGRLVPPTGTVHHQTDQDTWSLTVSNFTEQTLHDIREANEVSGVHVRDLELEDIFKDYVKGTRPT